MYLILLQSCFCHDFCEELLYGFGGFVFEDVCLSAEVFDGDFVFDGGGRHGSILILYLILITLKGDIQFYLTVGLWVVFYQLWGEF